MRTVIFTRMGERAGGLQRLKLEADGRAFSAWVGREAVVQLHQASMLARHGLTLVRTLSAALGLHLVRGRADEDGAAVAARLAGELAVVPDLYRARAPESISIPPNDPRYGGQWYLKLLKIEDAWRISSGARTTNVAIIDDGCDLAHPDLKAQLLGGIDVYDGDDDASYSPDVQGNEHGTACAGIVAASGDNGIGIAGTCPECTLSCIRLLAGGGPQLIPLSSDLAAFQYAIDTDAAVISNSWGYVESGPVDSMLAQQIARVVREGNAGRGTVVVFAAGNENRVIEDDELLALPGVIVVGAVNQFDEAAPFANHGAALDLSAPTGSLTTDISGPDGASSGDYTDLFGGTSAACPVVAGIAGLLRSAEPRASASAIVDVLQRTARKAPFATPGSDGHDEIYGYGIVDPVAALRALVPADDAGVRDAGTPPAVVDAATLDAATLDAQVPDARAPEPDASAPEVKRDDGGCTLATRPSHAWLGLLMFGWMARKRRRAAFIDNQPGALSSHSRLRAITPTPGSRRMPR